MSEEIYACNNKECELRSKCKTYEMNTIEGAILKRYCKIGDSCDRFHTTKTEISREELLENSIEEARERMRECFS